MAQQSIQRFLREKLVPAEDPRQWVSRCTAKSADCRYCVGDLRLICDIQDEKITVLNLEIGDRKSLYR